MTRREFIVNFLTTLVASPAAARSNAISRLVICDPWAPEARMQEDSGSRFYQALFGELRRLGHIEGQNLIVERYGKEKGEALEAVSEQIISTRPDVIYVVGHGAKFFKRVTGGFAVVTLTGDPIAQGLIQTLSHPGANITGVSTDAGNTIHGKRIELLREMFPGLTKLAFLTSQSQWSGGGPNVRRAAETLGIELVGYPVDLPANESVYEESIAKARVDGANGIMVADNRDTVTNRAAIVKFVAATNLPAIYASADFVKVGGLMAYSFDLVELNKQIARDIDAILRGASPADIPFYQATKFELSINLKTAKALSLSVPATLLASAEEVIE